MLCPDPCRPSPCTVAMPESMIKIDLRLGPAWKHIMLFAYNETYWLEAYADAWSVATTNVMKYAGKDQFLATSRRLPTANAGSLRGSGTSMEGVLARHIVGHLQAARGPWPFSEMCNTRLNGPT